MDEPKPATWISSVFALSVRCTLLASVRMPVSASALGLGSPPLARSGTGVEAHGSETTTAAGASAGAAPASASSVMAAGAVGTCVPRVCV